MNLQDRRILVTGGAGFVGSNLVKRLVRERAKVTVLDDLFTGRVENLPADHEQIQIRHSQQRGHGHPRRDLTDIE